MKMIVSGYIFPRSREVECVKFVSYISIQWRVIGRSIFHNTSHPNHAFKKHEKSTRHKKLELKLSSNEASVYNHIIVGAEKINLNKRHTNHLYMLN